MQTPILCEQKGFFLTYVSRFLVISCTFTNNHVKTVWGTFDCDLCSGFGVLEQQHLQ